MPIRPEQRAKYPKDWYAISHRIRFERARGRCEWCDIKDGALGCRIDGRWFDALPKGTNMRGLDWPRPGEQAWCSNGTRKARGRIIRIVLTVAHLDHDPTNNADGNLAALCQKCHNGHDAKHRAQGIRSRRRAKLAIGDLLNG